MIIDDYLEYSRIYKEKYGDKCIVLMQVGSFYELYSIGDNDIYQIADLCNIQISRKNKSINEISISNPLMAGFPLYTISKYTQILLNNNYTIVLIEQVTEPPNPERKVTEILSPGMNISITNKKSNYIMVLYFEFINGFLIAGISGIELSTGKTFIYEVGSSKNDPEYANDEVFRYICAYNPTELIILSNEITKEQKNYVLKNLNINNILVHYKWESYEYLDIMRKLTYQKGILEKAFFSKKNMLSIIEVLNLEKLNIARISFCCLLQFAYEHNADIIKELQVPEIFENNKKLNIEFNSSLQLNMIGLNQGDKPLIDILNRCSTAFGSRAFKDRLLMPITECDKLNNMYDDIDILLKDNLHKDVRKKLNNVLDLERIKRKMILSKIAPMEWSSFDTSLTTAKDVCKLLDKMDGNIWIDKIEQIISDYNTIIDIEEASKYNLADKTNIGNFFNEGIYKDVDDAVFEYNKSYEEIKNINDRIYKLGGQSDITACKIEYNERDGHYITITKKRYDTAMTLDREYMCSFEKKSLTTSSNYKLTNNEMNVLSLKMNKYSMLISSIVLKYYNEFVKRFIEINADTIDGIIKYLTRIDLACCCARNAYEYCYTRPKIENREASYIDGQNIRHPIIERIDDNVEYIGNDIKLFGNGILLYGINASGKSSFMKAIGLNIIMAQAGMFVSASSFKFHPYDHIFTRISGMDNIYKGMSSFTVEMTELRNILQRCNKNSLVIGDEICCGTEFVSATAIVASGVDTLVTKRSSFIFATHLHELTKLNIMKGHIKNQNVMIKHMHIHTDDNNRIIYDRKIQDGQGSNVYGIEVCKSLDMPTDFMKNAEIIRKEVQGLNQMLIMNKKSRYNSNVLMDKCGVCGEPAIDTHHIKYQSNANDEGFMECHHKNIKHNLVPLCKECHIKEHNNEITIKGYIETTNGIVLDYEK